LGVFLHPEFDYGLYKTEKGNLVVAKELAETVFKTLGISYELLKEFKGTELEKTHYRHPFLNREGLVMIGDYVTADAGTGAVHSAPGHGADDYNYSRKYELGVLSPVDDKGSWKIRRNVLCKSKQRNCAGLDGKRTFTASQQICSLVSA